MTKKSLSFLSPSKLVGLIFKIHGAVLDVAVYITSLLFIGLMLAVLIEGFPLQYYVSFLLLAFIVIKFFKKGLLSEKIISAYFYALRKIAIFTSIAIIFLFLNYFFGFFSVLNQKFFIIWQILEKIMNKAVFSAMLPIVFGLIYIYLVVAFLFLIRFITDKTKLRDKMKDGITGILLVIFVVLIPFIALFGDYFSKFLEPKLYPKIGWIFSCSLIVLHSNYLIKELLKSIKLAKIKI